MASLPSSYPSFYFRAAVVKDEDFPCSMADPLLTAQSLQEGNIVCWAHVSLVPCLRLTAAAMSIILPCSVLFYFLWFIFFYLIFETLSYIIQTGLKLSM